MDIFAFLGAVPKIAFFLLLIVGGAIVAEIAYFTKKKWPGNGTDSLSQEPATQKLQESSATMPPPPPKLTIEEVIPPKTPRINKKTLTTIAVFFVLAVSLPTAVFLVRQRQEIRKEAAPGDCCGCNLKEGDDGTCDIPTLGCGGEQWCATPTPEPTNTPLPCTPGDCCDIRLAYDSQCNCNVFKQSCDTTIETPTPVPGATSTPTPTPTPTPVTGCVNFDTVTNGVSATWTGGSGSAGVSWTKCDCLGVHDFCGTGCQTVKSITFSGSNPASDQYTFFPQDCSTAQIDATTTNGCTGSEHGIVVQNDNNCTSPTPTPTSAMSCTLIKAYDLAWNQITDLTTLTSGQAIYLANAGTTTDAAGITMTRFRINGGTWQETTTKHGSEFYIPYTIPAAGTFQVESMVYNPTLGWH